MGGRWQAWWRLCWHEKLTVIGLLLGLPMVALVLRIAGYVRTRRWIEALSRTTSSRPATPTELQEADRLAHLALLAGRRGLIKASCLRQALLVYGLLRRRGLAPFLQLGVRRQGWTVDAHAWVELEGVALAQANLAHVALRSRSSNHHQLTRD